MELFIDDHEVDSESVGDGTLGDALRHVQATLCAPGRLVVSLRCDGQDIPAGEMAGTLNQPVSSFQQLEISTSTQGELVQETMTQAGTSLTETEAECDRIADRLIEGKTAEAMEALGNCMAVWQQIHDGVSKSIQLLELDVTRMEIGGEPLIDLIARPKDVLLQIKQALECQDHVLLADTLKYEFSDVIREWHAILGLIRRHADPGESSMNAPN